MVYKLLLTHAGAAKVANAANTGSSVQITEFAVGQGIDVDFSQRLDKQVLVSKRYQGAIHSINAGIQPNQYEIHCIIPIDIGGFTIREFGLIDSDGTLVWVGSLPEVQKPDSNSTAAIDYRIKAVVQIDNPLATLIIDGNVVTATQNWVELNFATQSQFNDHLNADDPHPQYVNSDRFNQNLNALAETIWHVHSKHMTDSTDWNPSIALKPFFGKETSWYLWTHVPVGIDASAAIGISVPMTADGVISGQTTRIWQRLPDGTSPPSYALSVDKVVADEGQTITFTLSTIGIAAGTLVDWELIGLQSDDITPSDLTGSFNVGSDGKASYSLTFKVDQNTEGSETLVMRLKYHNAISASISVDDKSLYPAGSIVGTYQIAPHAQWQDRAGFRHLPDGSQDFGVLEPNTGSFGTVWLIEIHHTAHDAHVVNIALYRSTDPNVSHDYPNQLYLDFDGQRGIAELFQSQAIFQTSDGSTSPWWYVLYQINDAALADALYSKIGQSIPIIIADQIF